MTADFNSAIRNAEGTLSVARDNMNMYERLHKQWREEYRIAGAVLDRLREAAGIPRDAPILKPAPEPHNAPPEVTIQQEVATAPAPLPPAAVATAAAANGLDRAGLRRQLKHWHIRYPLAKSYKSPGQFARQAFRSQLIDHPEYLEKWIDTGHQELTDHMNSPTVAVLENCGKILGIEYEPIRRQAYKLQRMVEIHGEPGVDYLWEPAL